MSLASGHVRSFPVSHPQRLAQPLSRIKTSIFTGNACYTLISFRLLNRLRTVSECEGNLCVSVWTLDYGQTAISFNKLRWEMSTEYSITKKKLHITFICFTFTQNDTHF